MEIEIPKIEMKKCPTCDGSGQLDVLHFLPFSQSSYKIEPCPICNGLGEIEKTRKNKQHGFYCIKTMNLQFKKSVIVTECEQKGCIYFSYCMNFLRIPKKERKKLTQTETFKRSKCFFHFYEYPQHICVKNEIKTNRIICSSCTDFIERNK